MARNAQAQHGQIQPGAKPFKKGGAVHDDAAQDKAMLKKAVKADCLTGKKAGGKVKACCK